MSPNQWRTRLLLLIIIALTGITFKQWVAVSCVTGVWLITWIPTRFELDRIGQIIFGIIALAITYVLVVVVGPPPKHPMSDFGALLRAFFSIWILLYSFLRLLLINPILSHRATLPLSLLAVIACGGNKIGPLFHLFVIVITLLSLWIIAEQDPARPTLSSSTPKRRNLLIFASILSVLLVSASSYTLPLLYDLAIRRLGLAFIPGERTGFNRYIRLGKLSKMIKSKRVVLRVRGKFQSTLHLRGIVYDRYYRQHWLSPYLQKTKTISVKNLQNLPKSSLTVEYVNGTTKRYFVPLRTKLLGASTPKIQRDLMGLFFPQKETTPGTIAFKITQKIHRPIAPPRKAELQLPKIMRPNLHYLATQWTKNAHTTEQKLDAISLKFAQDYRYSLSFERDKRKEPIFDFLYDNKQGHCEYFASAFALLARSIKIPTRVVGGFLVSEYNSLGGYYIVREQNAHAWVEAWLPKRGWVTFDPTPPSGISQHMPKESGLLPAILDLLSVWIEKLRLWVTTLTWTQLSLLIGFFVLAWIGIRVLRHFRNKIKTPPKPSLYSPPIPAFEDLLATLESSLSKRDSEPLENYAERLKKQTDLPEPIRNAYTLVLDYASYRYGKRGDPSDLEARIHDWLLPHNT